MSKRFSFKRPFIAVIFIICLVFLLWSFPVGPQVTEKHEIDSVRTLEKFISFSQGNGRVTLEGIEVICMTGNYVFALEETRKMLDAKIPHSDYASLRAAGGLQDEFNGDMQTAIVLISDAKAYILTLDLRKGMHVGIIGCAGGKTLITERIDRIGHRHYHFNHNEQ